MKPWIVLIGICCLGCDLLVPSTDEGNDEGNDESGTQSDGNCILKNGVSTCDTINDPYCCDEDSIGCNGMELTRPFAGFCDVQPVEGQECYMSNINSPNLCCNTHGGLGAVGTVSTSCIPNDTYTCTTDANCMLGDVCYFDDFSGEYLCGNPNLGYSCVTPYNSPYPMLGCCEGLIVGDDGYCGLQSGASCLENRECASRICVRGETTATCQ